MRQVIRFEEVLPDGDLCNGCCMLSIEGQTGECMAGYWSEDTAWDADLSESEGKLTYIRPESCIEENNVEADK